MIFYTIDFKSDIPASLQPALAERIRKIYVEPPKDIMVVLVTMVALSQLRAVNADFACRVIACGVGGVPLSLEWSFILYRKPEKPDVLLYAQSRAAA
jgi:hypothetical protein